MGIALYSTIIAAILLIYFGVVYLLHFEDPNTYSEYLQWSDNVDWNGIIKPKVAVIGSGVCGLTMSQALKQHKIEFKTFDKNDQIGGNWYNGVYDVCFLFCFTILLP